MLITQDYGCELFKYLLDENKGEFNFDESEHKYVLDMIIRGKLLTEEDNLPMDFKTYVEYVFKELSYFGCHHMLKELFTYIKKREYKIIQKNIENSTKHIKDFTQKHLIDYLRYAEFSLEYLKTKIDPVKEDDAKKEDVNKLNKNLHVCYYLAQNVSIPEEYWVDNLPPLNMGMIETILNQNRYLYKLCEKVLKKKGMDIAVWRYAKLDEDFLEKHMDGINWMCLSENYKVPESFFRKHITKFNFASLCLNTGLSEQFFEDNIKKVKWHELCKNSNISSKFYEKYLKKIKWARIAENPNMDEEFLDKYSDKFSPEGWVSILCDNPKISEEFIIKHLDDKMDIIINGEDGDEDIIYNIIDRRPNISENFLQKYIEKIHFEGMLAYEDKYLSKEFILRNCNLLSLSDCIAYKPQMKPLDEDDPRLPKNKYSATYWLKVKSFYSFDKLWKKE